MCYGVTRLRSLKDNTIKIYFDLAMESIFNRTDVCPLYGSNNVRTTVIRQKNVSPSVIKYYQSCVRAYGAYHIFFSMTPLLLIARTYGHATVCVFETAVDTIFCSVSHIFPPILCSNFHFFVAITFIILSNT
jgi:hypothetical protein